ncbi:MAG: hypothetical protein AAFZ65_00535 [Planctomycetota bacterium]
MWKSASPLLALLALSGIANAQGFNERGTPSPRPGHRAATPTGDAALGGLPATSHLIGAQPVSIGPNWKALYRAGGVTFVPALGATAPATRTIEFRFEGASVGNVPIGTYDHAVEPLLVEDQIQFLRGDGLTELYEATSEGLAQSFVFDRLPLRDGDLVVTGTLTTDLERASDPAAGARLRFTEPGLADVTIRDVLGYDARGREVPGTLSLQGDRLELRLPASFVAQAELPLVLDPVVGVETQVFPGPGLIDEDEVDVAHGRFGFLRKYCMVFSRYFSSTDTDIVAVRVDTNSGVFEQTYLIEQDIGFIDTAPVVAFNAVEGTFPICWQRQTGTFGSPSVRATFVPISLSTVQPAVSLGFGREPDVGSSRSSGNRAVCVFNAGTTIRTRYFTVTPGVPPAPGPVVQPMVAATASGFSNPCISKGDTDNGLFMIVAEEIFVPDRDLQMTVVDGFANNVSNDLSLFSIGPNEQHPDVATDGSDFMLVFDREQVVGNQDSDVIGQKIDLQSEFFGFTIAFEGEDFEVSAKPFDDERNPAVACSRHEWTVVWEDQFAGLPFYDVYLATFGRDECLLCEPHQLVSTPVDTNVLPEIAGTFDGGAPISESKAAVAYTRESGAGLTPYWREWESVPGTTTFEEFDDGCPGGGNIGIGGLLDLGGNLFMSASDVQPGFALAILNLVGTGAPLSCGSCAIQPLGFTFAAEPFFDGTGAGIGFPVPCKNTLDGVELTFQFIFVGSGASPCTGLPNVTASNTMKVTLGY